jgi:hypothetical protein
MNHHYYSTNDMRSSKPFHPALLLAGIVLMGSSNGVLYYLQWLIANAESLLVTSYAFAVLFYLSWVAFWKQLEPKKKRILVPAQETTTFPEPAATVISTTVTPILDEAAAISLPLPPTDNDDLSQQQPVVVDLTGVYKLISNDGFEDFLAVQGVPWALRRAANQARPVHRITHNGNTLTIKIEGIIESQTTYTIGGQPVETNVRGRIFEDSVAYLNDGRAGVLVSKRAITEEYDVTVQRILSKDKQQIHMTSTALFRDGREPIKSFQVFNRIVE